MASALRTAGADRFTILISLYDLALSRQAGGDLDDATDLLRQGVSLAAEAGDEPSLAYYLEALSDVAARRDRAEHAVSLLAAAAALLRGQRQRLAARLRAARSARRRRPGRSPGPHDRSRPSGRPGRTAAPSTAPRPSATRWKKASVGQTRPRPLSF